MDVRARELFTPSQIGRAERYSSLQRHLGWASLGVSLAVSALLGLTPLGALLARRVPGPWWVRAIATAALVVLAGVLATLPTGLLARRNAVRFGLTEQSLAGWVRDQALSALVVAALAGVMVLLVLGAARRSPRRWPLGVALGGALLTVLGSWVYPVVMEPLFNDFSSLAHGELRTRIMALARAEHVPVSDVLVADASRRTTTLNAYVSGFGSTRRIVLYDNLVSDVPERETLVIVAHELGHARHQDVLLGTLLGAGGVGLGAGLLGLVLRRRSLLDRAGVPGPGHPEAVALVMALVTFATLVASPVENTVSRAIEARADRGALEATGDYAGFTRSQVQLATRSLSDPSPPAWSQFWFGSHPTTLQRVGLARALRADR